MDCWLTNDGTLQAISQSCAASIARLGLFCPAQGTRPVCRRTHAAALFGFPRTILRSYSANSRNSVKHRTVFFFKPRQRTFTHPSQRLIARNGCATLSSTAPALTSLFSARRFPGSPPACQGTSASAGTFHAKVPLGGPFAGAHPGAARFGFVQGRRGRCSQGGVHGRADPGQQNGLDQGGPWLRALRLVREPGFASLLAAETEI